MEKNIIISSIILKVKMGEIIFHLLKIFFYDWNLLMNALKSQKILYSKNDLEFAVNLFKLCKKFPKLRYVSIPLRKIKTNLSLVSSIMNEDKDFWTNTAT